MAPLTLSSEGLSPRPKHEDLKLWVQEYQQEGHAHSLNTLFLSNKPEQMPKGPASLTPTTEIIGNPCSSHNAPPFSGRSPLSLPGRVSLLSPLGLLAGGTLPAPRRLSSEALLTDPLVPGETSHVQHVPMLRGHFSPWGQKDS